MHPEIFVQINQTNFPAHEAKLITTDPINSIVRASLREFVNFTNGRKFRTPPHKIHAKYETNIHITVEFLQTKFYRFIFYCEILDSVKLSANHEFAFPFFSRARARVCVCVRFFLPILKFVITNSVDLFDKCKFLRFVYKFVHGRGILNGCIVQ